MSDKARRDVLVERIASNKKWLSKNWHHGKEVRRSCQANIERDEAELAKLDTAIATKTPVKASNVDQPRSAQGKCFDGADHIWVIKSARGHDEVHCGRCMICLGVETMLRAYVKLYGGSMHRG